MTRLRLMTRPGVGESVLASLADWLNDQFPDAAHSVGRLVGTRVRVIGRNDVLHSKFGTIQKVVFSTETAGLFSYLVWTDDKTELFLSAEEFSCYGDWYKSEPVQIRVEIDDVEQYSEAVKSMQRATGPDAPKAVPFNDSYLSGCVAYIKGADAPKDKGYATLADLAEYRRLGVVPSQLVSHAYRAAAEVEAKPPICLPDTAGLRTKYLGKTVRIMDVVGTDPFTNCFLAVGTVKAVSTEGRLQVEVGKSCIMFNPEAVVVLN